MSKRLEDVLVALFTISASAASVFVLVALGIFLIAEGLK